MDIALVAPSPVPYAVGGAENLFAALSEQLRAQPGVECELLKLPSPEADFWSIIDSYRRFAALDLRHFDRVISTKYPAWMVAHPDHHVYLQHTLRGLYDTYPPTLPVEVAGNDPEVARVLAVLRTSGPARHALSDIFAALDALHEARDRLPASLFALPGPLLRTVVHALDRIALSTHAIRWHGAISREVAGRADYFPGPLPPSRITVYHHPSISRPRAAARAPIPEGAIFTASRLETPKRVELIVQAHRQAGVSRPLFIAGDGPNREAIRALIGNSPHVTLLGRLGEAELAAAYEAAGFVVFVPQREDYGLITVEALQAGKPVITTSDSGGVTELVQHDVNGLVTAPDPKALGHAVRALAENPERLAALSANARSSIRHVSWQPIVDRFTRRWPRLLVLSTFPIGTAQSGGQLRLFQLYRGLARHATIDVLSFTTSDEGFAGVARAPGLFETCVPFSRAHRGLALDLEARLGVSAWDLAVMLEPALTPAFTETMGRLAEGAAGVVLSHPFTWTALKNSGVRLPTIYDAHNVEADLKAQMLPGDSAERAGVAATEGECARAASLVFCCSAQDAARLQSLYSLADTPSVAANGIDADSYIDADAPASGRAGDARAGRGDHNAQPVALFVGSYHAPNIEAAKAVRQLAEARPTVAFIVVGSVCDAAEDICPDATPGNLRLLGRVSETELRRWLARADVGLNPVVTGSGTNLKLLQYAAAGVPILSTTFGARGGLLRPDVDMLTASLDEFAPALDELLSNRAETLRRAESAQARATREGDWQQIASDLWPLIDEALTDAANAQEPAAQQHASS